MGQRANLIVVERGQYQLFYSHWCANTLTRDLFWGPEYAVQFIRMQRAVDESGWLDEVWAEGAAVVDLDEQALLLFGGEDILYDVPLRRVYLELLSRVWKPWAVRWAHEGIATISDYVGYPRECVLTKDADDARASSLAPPDERDWIDTVASVRWSANRLRIYPLAGDPKSYLYGGPNLLKIAPEDDHGLERLDLGERTEFFPNGGLHIDVPAQIVEFWTAKDAPGVLSHVSPMWLGWTVRWHQDEFEFQSERTQGALQFPRVSRAALVTQISEMLLREYGRSGADSVREVAELLSQDEGKEVDINPSALRDDRLELPIEVRGAIVTRSLGSNSADS